MRPTPGSVGPGPGSGSRYRPAPLKRQRGGVDHARSRAGREREGNGRAADRINPDCGLIGPRREAGIDTVEPLRSGRARSVAGSRAFESTILRGRAIIGHGRGRLYDLVASNRNLTDDDT